MKPVTRRGWLQTTAFLAGAPCACLAQNSNDCCTVPDAPPDGVHIQPGLVTIRLDQTPASAAPVRPSRSSTLPVNSR